mgnify:CR=1 FL=1
MSRLKLLQAISDSMSTFLSMGFITLNTRQHGLAPAWTEWRPGARHFAVYVLDDVVERLSLESLRTLVEHEINHVVCAHFSITCKSMCSILATESEANGWISTEAQTKLEEELGCEGVHVDSVYIPLGLDPKRVVRAEIVHTMLHTEEEGEGSGGYCGGIATSDDPIAAMIGAAVGILQEAGEGTSRHGPRYGTGSSMGQYAYKPVPVPPWAEQLLAFARSIVEEGLADKRAHSHPIMGLRQIGIHVPKERSRWEETASLACVIVDTSGSMYCGDILNYTGQAISYLREHEVEVRLILGDTKVLYDKVVEGMLPTPMVGGGGTDIVPLFGCAAKYKPRSIIMITDGEIPAWPKAPADCRTQWVDPGHIDPPVGDKVG